MILVPDADQPVVLGRGGEEKAVRREGKEVDRVGWPDLPNACPTGTRLVRVVASWPHSEPYLGLWRIKSGTNR